MGNEQLNNTQNHKHQPNSALKERPIRPNIKDFFPDASLVDMHNLYSQNPKIWAYIQAMEQFIDQPVFSDIETELDEHFIITQIIESINQYDGTNEAADDAAYYIAHKHRKVLQQYMAKCALTEKELQRVI